MCYNHDHNIGTIYNFQFLINLQIILVIFGYSKRSRLWFLLTETLGKSKNSLPLKTSNDKKNKENCDAVRNIIGKYL